MPLVRDWGGEGASSGAPAKKKKTDPPPSYCHNHIARGGKKVGEGKCVGKVSQATVLPAIHAA